ncbi:MAG TPA: hypothetical protein VHS54_00200 [Jatrophihabitans sp.]|jgi:hypothetical protein|nr:hypothetical protein [Jatrophihabitans sp.]
MNSIATHRIADLTSARPRRVDQVTPAMNQTTNFNHSRSIKMYALQEALARDRMREKEQRSREARLARALAAENRWHRVSLHARAAQARHARRVSRVSAW